MKNETIILLDSCKLVKAEKNGREYYYLVLPLDKVIYLNIGEYEYLLKVGAKG